MSAHTKMFLATSAAVLLCVLVLMDFPTGTEAGKGHGHGKGAGGTACIVKGSYCSCHYCKCEKGWVHCGKKHGYGECSTQVWVL